VSFSSVNLESRPLKAVLHIAQWPAACPLDEHLRQARVTAFASSCGYIGALTGIEGANGQFSSVQAQSKYVQLVRCRMPETRQGRLAWSLGCHLSLDPIAVRLANDKESVDVSQLADARSGARTPAGC